MVLKTMKSLRDCTFVFSSERLYFSTKAATPLRPKLQPMPSRFSLLWLAEQINALIKPCISVN